MKIQFNTDNNIKGSEALEASVSEKIKKALKHFSNKITRIEVHLSDQNSHKAGADDIQCKIEARLENMKPVTVIGKSSTKEAALDDAVSKIKAALASIIGKMRGN